jgi:single-stranded-DNA-specific exonuclease
MPAFRSAINELARSRISDEDLKKKIRIDTRLSFDAITMPFLEQYGRLVPFGVGNPKPVFLAEGIEILSEPKTMQGKHMKFWAKQNGRVFEALGWDKAAWAPSIARGEKVDLVYTLYSSEYLGEQKVSLVAEDIGR